MKILVTGAAGYIGSFMCLKLLEENHDVVGIDNLSLGSSHAIRMAQVIAKREMSFYNVDVGNISTMKRIFDQERPKLVIHFAAFKDTRASLNDPAMYYQNNVASTLNLLSAMKICNVNQLIFSSSCTVYDQDNEMPLTEDSELGPITPYGKSKLIVENVIRDFCELYDGWSAVSLRYFNPAGAHKSGLMGESQFYATGLFPAIQKVLIDRNKKLKVYGKNYDTVDGTPVRDYVHIEDLIEAHMLQIIKVRESTGYDVYNVGSGKGYSVLEVIEAVEKASKREIPYEIVEAKEGDVGVAFSDYEKIKAELMWGPTRDLDDICDSFFRWVSITPKGYSK